MTPFERADPVMSEEWKANVRRDCLAQGFTEADVDNYLMREAVEGEFYLNDTYQVCKRTIAVPEGWPEMVWLSIKRRDRDPIHDWRELQEIKDQIVGAECEGVELYPADSRKVDSANQYHLYVLADPEARWPFGFQDRAVNYDVSIAGSRQRPERG